jgi:hypothetical protein
MIRPAVMLLLMLAVVALQAQNSKALKNCLVTDVGGTAVEKSTLVTASKATPDNAAAEKVAGVVPNPMLSPNTVVDLSQISNYGGGGPSDALLYNNGPFVTHLGGGAGGADVSALQTDLTMANFGFNCNHAVSPGNNYYIADDFVVTSTWTIDDFRFYGYQTNSTTTSTFNGAYVLIYNGPPNAGGTVVWGNYTTNRYSASSWTSCYRATITALTNAQRPIMEITAVTPGLVLTPGTYWVEWGLTGTLTSGPWANPITILGSTTTGNALQKTAAATYAAIVDVGPQGMPFKINGTASGQPANDLGVTLITSPVSGPPGPQNVTVNIQNFGTAPQSVFNVTYLVTPGGSLVTQAYNGAAIPGNGSASFTFTTGVTLAGGSYTIQSCTVLSGDATPGNDCSSKPVEIIPAPVNDECEDALLVDGPYPETVTGSLYGATVDCPGLLDWNAVWYEVTLPYGINTLDVDFCGTVYTGSPSYGVIYYNQCNDCPNYVLYDLYSFDTCVDGNIWMRFGNIPGPATIFFPVYIDQAIPFTVTFDVDEVECVVPCPPGASSENEAQIPNEGADITNGGCNMLPATPLFTPITNGQTYCGQTNTYTVGTTNRRDTDWYRFDMSSPANTYWSVNITAQAEFALQVLLINAGSDNCTDYSIVAVATGIPCEIVNLTGDFPSGIYYIWMGPQTATGYPYGGGPWDYAFTLNYAAIGAPVASVTPLSFEVDLAPEQTTTQTLTIGNTGTYKLDYFANTTGTTVPVWADNFDARVLGYLAQQSIPTDWTTWSAAPGGPEDANVVNTVVYNGTQSVEITGLNDLVHPFPNYTDGKWKISFRMYVPTGFDGYFNTLQLFAGATSEWGMQVYFDAGGVASIDAGASSAATWSFSYDQWFYNEIYVDLDNDYAEYYFDGNLIVGWTWSGGSFGTGTLKQLGGNNFYAYAGTQTPKYYFDDYKFEQLVNDWLTLNNELSAGGTIAVGGPNVDITVGFSSVGKAAGTYDKVINLVTNEFGAKKTYVINAKLRVGFALTGFHYYGETNTKPMATLSNITLTPTVPPGPPITVTPTAPTGAYDIRPLGNGSYALTGSTTKPWNGMTTFDATLILRYTGGVIVFSNLQKRAADVNMTNTAAGVTTFDATLILRRAASQPTPQWSAPPFVYDGPYPSTPALIGYPITINNGNQTLNFRTLCSGDINGSYTPWTP